LKRKHDDGPSPPSKTGDFVKKRKTTPTEVYASSAETRTGVLDSTVLLHTDEGVGAGNGTDEERKAGVVVTTSDQSVSDLLVSECQRKVLTSSVGADIGEDGRDKWAWSGEPEMKFVFNQVSDTLVIGAKWVLSII